jgi:bacillithiol biosynthesis cysteine-adding enzyme BshC
MHLHKIALADTHSFSSFFLDYISQKDSLKSFYLRFPLLQNFKEQLAEKSNSFPPTSRKVLSGALTRQYKGIKITDEVTKNLGALTDSKTFTVTTGHQLNIFTGPLYFIYKIVTVINTCRELKTHYPEYNFVPVYWMASEDHDYEEIKSFRLYEKKYSWNTDQTGAVGRFDPKSLVKLIEELPGDVSVFSRAYTKSQTLAGAVRRYVNDLFGSEGLLVVDADDRELKSLFTKVIHDDLFVHTPRKLVEEKNAQLETLGYHPQVFAREINFFYLDKNVRHRFEKSGEEFKVVDTSLKFTSEEIEKMIASEPDKFSPNVILRPLYQEVILPNLAYVGGPAEVVYWLQLKGVFDYFKVPFPILMPRNFAAVMNEPISKKFEKTGLDLKDLFEEKNFLFNHWITKNSDAHLSLGDEIKEAEAVFRKVKDHASKIDVTLNKHVEAQTLRMVHSLQDMERKMLRAEKRKQADRLRQVGEVKDFMFPNGGPQERIDNFLNFYQQDTDFINKLLSTFDPLDFRFNVLMP